MKRFVRAGDLSCAVRLSNVQVDSSVIKTKRNHPSLSFNQPKPNQNYYCSLFLFEIQPHYYRHLAILIRSTSNPISPWNFLNFLNTAATDCEARGRSVRLVVVALLWLGRHCQHVTHARTDTRTGSHPETLRTPNLSLWVRAVRRRVVGSWGRDHNLRLRSVRFLR